MTEHLNTFTVISLFPDFVGHFLDVGIIGRAHEQGRIAVTTLNPRDFSDRADGRVDDAPYGGGPGMVMRVAPLRRAIAKAREKSQSGATVAYMSPHGRRLDQAFVHELAHISHLVLVAGRYEGIDERVIERDIDMEISLGDFVLSGGELAAFAVIDAVARTLSGVLGNAASAASDSFSDGLLEFPQYTRPEAIDEQSVPAVLLGGNHAEIARWRRGQALLRTYRRRPDLFATVELSDEDRQLISELGLKI